MKFRMSKVDEVQFLTCVQHEVWGSMIPRFSPWKIGDHLAIIVNKHIAGLAEVTGTRYVSQEIVWDNGLFPHRIPLKFIHIMHAPNRLPMIGEIRDALIAIWGPKYGVGILNQLYLPEDISEKIISLIQDRKNDLDDIKRNFTVYLNEARLYRDEAAKLKSKKTN
jgi:hypothetical protein